MSGGSRRGSGAKRKIGPRLANGKFTRPTKSYYIAKSVTCSVCSRRCMELVESRCAKCCACGSRKSEKAKQCVRCWKQALPSRVVRVCVGCGVQFSRKANYGDALKYCSRACAFADPNWRGAADKRAAKEARRPKPKPCEICGAVCKSLQAKCCSRECAKEKARRASYVRDPLPKQLLDKCACCGSSMGLADRHTKGPKAKRLFCSAACRNRMGKYSRFWSGVTGAERAEIVETARLLRALHVEVNSINQGRVQSSA